MKPTARATNPAPVDVPGSRAPSALSRRPPVGAANRGPLIPAYNLSGPRIRLGLAWLVVTMVAVVGGIAWLAAWLALNAGLAALQTAQSWTRLPGRSRPVAPIAAAIAVAAVLATAAGLKAGAIVVVMAALVGMLAAFVVGLQRGEAPQRAAAGAGKTLGCSVFPALGAGAPIVAYHQGSTVAGVLLATAVLHDASSFLIGSGASTRWEGPAAAAASIGALSLAVAAVLAPPFDGPSPWVLGGLAAVLAPFGPLAASAAMGDRRVRAAALRRLDSLAVMGPVWAIAALVLLR